MKLIKQIPFNVENAAYDAQSRIQLMGQSKYGIILGALLSSGMMDVARHGIMNPQTFSFEEVMTIFLAVMCTDVIILDVFNTFGMPTSTTVSLVFELLGGTFVLALIKVIDKSEPNDFSYYLNSEQALKVIIAIFVSVAIAFIVGLLVS